LGGSGHDFAGRKLGGLKRDKFKGASCPNLVALQERTICYCSNFDLNAGEWIQAYDNMQLFVINL